MWHGRVSDIEWMSCFRAGWLEKYVFIASNLSVHGSKFSRLPTSLFMTSYIMTNLRNTPTRYWKTPHDGEMWGNFLKYLGISRKSCSNIPRMCMYIRCSIFWRVTSTYQFEQNIWANSWLWEVSPTKRHLFRELKADNFFVSTQQGFLVTLYCKYRNSSRNSKQITLIYVNTTRAPPL